MKRISVAAIAIACALSSSVAEIGDGLLRGIEGVGLEVLPLNMRSNRFDLDAAAVKKQAIKKLDELQVQVLASSEINQSPGRPFLEISINIAHASGPSHLYSITLKLREMAALERPKDNAVSMALSTWERESIGVANRPEAVLQTVDRMIYLFSEDFHRMNVEEQK